MEQDDVALVHASQRGDRDAFGSLISRHAPSIFSLATRMMGPADADDVAQETFVAAYKALAAFKFDSKFSTWLYRIGVNKCTDALRARKTAGASIDSAVTVDDDTALTQAADHQTPHWELEQVELAGELDREIRALPDVYRESFILKHIEGLDYDEMSAILGVNRDTLKMRVYKARTLLCRSLAHLEGTYR